MQCQSIARSQGPDVERAGQSAYRAGAALLPQCAGAPVVKLVRHSGLKIPRPHGHAGSSPARGTKDSLSNCLSAYREFELPQVMRGAVSWQRVSPCLHAYLAKRGQCGEHGSPMPLALGLFLMLTHTA